MPHRQLALSWEYDLRRARARVLGAMYLIGGMLCLGSGLFAHVPDAHYAVTLAIGAVAVLVSAVLIVAGERFPPAVVQGLLAGYSLLIGVLAVASVRVVGVVSLGPAVIGGAMYAGYFLTGIALWTQVMLGVVAYVAGGVFSAARPEIVSLVSVIVTAVAVAAILHRLTQELLARSTLDSLTGTVSRAAWLQAAEQSLRRPESDTLCVAIVDLDDFKAVNDESGHLAGDELLRQVSGALLTGLPLDTPGGRPSVPWSSGTTGRWVTFDVRGGSDGFGRCSSRLAGSRGDSVAVVGFGCSQRRCRPVSGRGPCRRAVGSHRGVPAGVRRPC